MNARKHMACEVGGKIWSCDVGSTSPTRFRGCPRRNVGHEVDLEGSSAEGTTDSRAGFSGELGARYRLKTLRVLLNGIAQRLQLLCIPGAPVAAHEMQPQPQALDGGQRARQ